MYAAKYINIQRSPYHRICFHVPARNGPAERRTAVATFSLLLATSSACCRCKVQHAYAGKNSAAGILLLAFPAKYCFLCKVQHKPSDSPKVYCRRYETDYDSLFVSRFLLLTDLLLLSDQHFHCFRPHIKKFSFGLFSFCLFIRRLLDTDLIKRTEVGLIYVPFNSEQEEITTRSAKFWQ